jgi:hypothetical protein
MSGYDPKTGIFELTYTKTAYYSGITNESMSYYANLLKNENLEVISIHSAFLKVQATQDQLWKVLSKYRK